MVSRFWAAENIQFVRLCLEMLGDIRKVYCTVNSQKKFRLASNFADEMLKEGIYVVSFSFPVVPKEKARIRVQISAAHQTDHIDQCVDAFQRVANRLNVDLQKISAN